MQVVSISVVIPLYNKAQRIASCLRSVLAQISPVDEIVLVDDGSVDDSARVAKLTLEGCSIPWRVISQENMGVSRTRNRGYRASKSDLIAFLDADDEWKPCFLDQMRRLVGDFPDAIMYGCRHQVVTENGRVREARPLVGSGFRGYVRNFFLASMRGSIINSSKCIVRKKALEQIGGFPEGAAVGEDIYVWMRLAAMGKVAFHDFVGASIVVEEDLSREGRWKIIPYPVIAYSAADAPPMTWAAKLYLRRLLVAHLLHYWRAGQYGEVYRCLEQARLLFPFASRLIFWMVRISSCLASNARR